MEFDPALNAANLPPLRAAGAGAEGGEDGPAAVAPQLIQDHEVETYREQDVSLSAVLSAQLSRSCRVDDDPFLFPSSRLFPLPLVATFPSDSATSLSPTSAAS